MKPRSFVSLSISFLAASLLGAGCTLGGSPESEGEDETYAPILSSESSLDLEEAPDCDVETPCPDGLECVYVDLAGQEEDFGAKCVNATTLCEQLDCGDGECLTLETYPLQVVCSSDPGDDDGDDGDGDEPVCTGGECP